MAPQEGLEPTAHCLESSCSIRLSYWGMYGKRTRKRLLLRCRHGSIPAPVGFHHYILLVPSPDGRARTDSNRQDAAAQGRDSYAFRSTPKLRAWAPIPISAYHPVLWIRFVSPPTNSHRICSQLCCGYLRFLLTKRMMVGRAGLEPAVFLMSWVYSPLPSPLGYRPIWRSRWGLNPRPPA